MIDDARIMRLAAGQARVAALDECVRECMANGTRLGFEIAELIRAKQEVAQAALDEAERAALPLGPDVMRWGDFVSTLVEARGWFRDRDVESWRVRLRPDNQSR